jgi:23S rRNA (cytosine1962-C5)-methyltransferase
VTRIDDPRTRPLISLVSGKHRRAEGGHPWIYSNEAALDAAAKSLPPGTLVTVAAADGKRLGVASFNAHALVTLRIFDRSAATSIDRDFIIRRLQRALSMREALFGEPFYRLIHAEADGLPGLVVDRYGGTIVCQLNSAGIAALEEPLIEALEQALRPETIIFRNDSPARAVEGLESEIRVVRGETAGPLRLRENDATFLADLSSGQKTGWFYDQRPNRAFIAALARDRRVLDVYSYTGGFGVLAARQGARRVVMVDRSESALALAAAAADANDVADKCGFERAEAFTALDAYDVSKQSFDVVILDPPAFVKAKKDLAAGSRGYHKLIRAGAKLVAPGGFLLAASCSHNMPTESFADICRQALADAGRSGRILFAGGAGPDHPVHPALPESAYLKAMVVTLD